MARICFQVEEAHWFYDDFIRPLNRSLPPMSLRTFCLAIFKRCPLLAPFPIENHVLAFEEFLKYKTSIPVRGAILLNETMDMALLVKGWKKGANWSFPKGKINMDEDDLDCAIREVDEETGFDIRAAGLVPPPEEVKYIETTFRDQQIRLYVFRNVPIDTYFEPKTRKEIGGIQWYKIDDLPTYRKKGITTNGGHGHETDDPSHSSTNNKFYMVAQFTGQLKKWIAQQRKKDAIRAGKDYLVPQISLAEDPCTEDEGSTLPEAIQIPITSATAADPTQILANASRDLRQMLQIDSLSPEQVHSADPIAAGPGDINQNRANALLAVLQKGGNAPAIVPPPGLSVNTSTSLQHLLPQASQSNAHTLSPQFQQNQQHQQHQQQHPLQQLPHPQQQQLRPPPGLFRSMPPPPGLPIRGQQGQSLADHNPYGASQLGSQQQQAYDKARLAQQNQHLQQRFQLQQPHQGQQPPQSSRQGQQQPMPGQNINPFVPNSQGQAPLYTANGNIVQGPSQSQARAQAAVAAFSPQQHPPPSVPLLHPQPLPPVVQKALFARELLASPDVGGHQNNALMPPPPPPPPHQSRVPQPPLSNHAAALLSAFKKDIASHAGAPGAPGAPDLPQSSPKQPQAPLQLQHPHRHASHNVSSKATQPGQQQQPPFATLPNSHTLHGSRPQPPPHQQPYGALPVNAQPVANSALQDKLLGRLTKHTDQHINSLLEMFSKKIASSSQATAAAPTTSLSLGHNARPQQAGSTTHGVITHQTTYSATTTSTAQGVHEPSQAQTLEAAALANGRPVEMNAELNLPFGALSLLTRPKNQDGSGSNNKNDLAGRSQHPSTFATPIVELPASTVHVQSQRPAAPQGSAVNRQQLDASSERHPSTREPHKQQQYGGSNSAVNTTLPMNSTVSRRPSHASSTAPIEAASYGHSGHSGHSGGHDQQQQPVNLSGPEKNSEHTQKLLSLFSRQPQVSPGTGSNPHAQPHASLPHTHHMHHTPPLSGSSRGSVGYGATASDSLKMKPADGLSSDSSRRGSQTPISAANRNFLLGYLASVSGAQ